MISPINYNGYGMAAQTPMDKRISGAPKQPAASVIYPTFKAVQTPSQDVVQISAGDKIKESSNSGKTGMSTGTKWALGIAGTILAGIAAHKFIPPMRVQSRVQRIFLEDFTKEEAKAIQKKYQEILKITDKDEFLDKLFTELKKDYKLDDVPIKLNKNGKYGEKYGALKAAASYNFADWTVTVDRSRSCQELLGCMCHELRHAKQELFAYKTSANDKEYFDIVAEKYKNGYRSILKEKGISDKEIEQELSKIKICSNNAGDKSGPEILEYADFGIKRIDSSDKNYEWGRKMLKSLKIFANENRDTYYRAPYEVDASNAGHLMSRMTNNKLGLMQKFNDWIRKQNELVR